MESFRIPPSALRKQYGFSAAALMIGGPLLAYAWKGVTLPADYAALTAAIFCFAVFVAYLIARRRIWVTLSPEGIRGKGFGCRNASLPWSASVCIAPISPPSVGSLSGITLVAVGINGSPTANGVFVPRAILQTAKFMAAVEKYAPDNHPLRIAFTDAT